MKYYLINEEERNDTGDDSFRPSKIYFRKCVLVMLTTKYFDGIFPIIRPLKWLAANTDI